MRAVLPTRHPGERPQSGTAMGAWLSLAAIPVFLVLGFATGEALLSALGSPSGGDAPVWARLVADLGALLVICVPCVAAIHFGLRAREAGERSGRVAIALGAAVAAASLLATVLTELADLLRG